MIDIRAQELKFWFARTGLQNAIEQRPLFNVRRVQNGDKIFQMTIGHRKNHNAEYFRVYLGAVDNNVKVVHAEDSYRQVLISVQEPKRKFIVRQWDPKKREHIQQVQWTPDFERKFLCGMDQHHLFISELPWVEHINSVKAAHDALQPFTVRRLKPSGTRVLRQGEWFFIRANPPSGGVIQKYRSARINRGGNPHIAEELWICHDSAFGARFSKVGTYVRGHIWHPEHDTLLLRGWHYVERNTELHSDGRRMPWID